MQDRRQLGPTGYWYPTRNTTGVELLNQLRRFRAAENAMRARTRASTMMNENELEAIRFHRIVDRYRERLNLPHRNRKN